MQPVCVGVGGGSGSGKTTLVRRLLEAFAGEGVALVEQDCYYRDQSGRSLEERSSLNYDHPDAIESGLIVRDVERLLRGEPAHAPQYDFATHTRCGEQVVAPGRLIIVEGILVLHWPRLRRLMDVLVFVEAGEPVRLSRRLARDVTERGRTAQSVRKQFEETVQPMHSGFVEPSRLHAGWLIPGDEGGEPEVLRLEEHIRQLLAQRGRRHAGRLTG